MWPLLQILALILMSGSWWLILCLPLFRFAMLAPLAGGVGVRKRFSRVVWIGYAAQLVLLALMIRKFALSWDSISADRLFGISDCLPALTYLYPVVLNAWLVRKLEKEEMSNRTLSRFSAALAVLAAVVAGMQVSHAVKHSPFPTMEVHLLFWLAFFFALSTIPLFVRAGDLPIRADRSAARRRRLQRIALSISIAATLGALIVVLALPVF